MSLKGITAYLTEDINARVENYLNSPVCAAKGKSDLLVKALVEFLEREEPIAKKIEKELQKLRKKL